MKDSAETPAVEQPLGLNIDRKTVVTITSILLVVMVFAGVMTQIVPQGEYLRDDTGTIIVEPQPDYVPIEGERLPIWKIITAPIMVLGSEDALTGIAIVLFIILIGGTFLILDKSGVLSYIMSSVVKKFSGKKYRLLAVMVFACMALSSIAGVLEESITLIPLAVAISLALGWDSLVGIGFSLVSIAYGFTAATFNPFNVGIVQSMAGLQLFSGLAYRLAVFAAVYVILVGFLILYAKKIEKNPKKSLVYENDMILRQKYSTTVDEAVLANSNLKKASIAFVSCIGGVLVCAAISFLAQSIDSLPDIVAEYIGYLPMVGMAVLFTVGGLKAGSIAGIKGKKLLSGFVDGVKAILPVVPLIFFVMAITYILREGKIIDTLLYYVYGNLSGCSNYVSLLIIFFLIIVLSFFIGSGTAKAFLIMPLVLPLADMLDVSRQSVVLAFSLSDGFCNILYPTSGVMLIALGLVNISYSQYIRWSWKLFLAAFTASVALLLIAVKIGYH